jgi:endogenous inhibitor of DNA gyrase (YacG/DUF329 family)
MISINGLKAFNVQGNEYGRIIFAKTNAEAKREGCNELGVAVDQVTCRRAKEFDEYAHQGKVPNKVLLEDHNWHFECSYCNNTVTTDDESRVWEDEAVFCSEECHAWRMNIEFDHKAKLERERGIRHEAEGQARAKFEHCTNFKAHVDINDKVSVYFNFPGGIEVARWVAGSEFISISNKDKGAWEAYRAPYREKEKELA